MDKQENPFGLDADQMAATLRDAKQIEDFCPAGADQQQILAVLIGTAKAAQREAWTFEQAVGAMAFAFGRGAQVVHINAPE